MRQSQRIQIEIMHLEFLLAVRQTGRSRWIERQPNVYRRGSGIILVCGTVEETLNAYAEADRLCGAGRYERNEARQDTRAGSYDRTLQTSTGGVNLKVPKLRRQTFETAIIERYRRRESSVEEALIEMYLAGILSAAGGGHYRSPLGHAAPRARKKGGPCSTRRASMRARRSRVASAISSSIRSACC